ncbi:3-methyladenine DNA glycosylase [Nakamurella flava]|nr:3-methyladenine DNA glycosylase [Nakamurella flava]
MNAPLGPDPDPVHGLMLLADADWRPLAAAHEQAADELTASRRARARVGASHPVEDFLFTYYRLRPGELRRWHPGVATALVGADGRAGWRHHRVVSTAAGVAVTVDAAALARDRAGLVSLLRRLLPATDAATPQFGCFGLHEWAMVYRPTTPPAGPLGAMLPGGSRAAAPSSAEPDARRHRAWPLRLGQSGTDAVVEASALRCSHYDAFRFFTPAAVPRNATTPDVDHRVANEQPACLHAGMDVYKWAYKLGPAVPGDLLLDAFRLARDIRAVDMRASPYDLGDLGYQPIAIETAAGKAEYVAHQRVFADRGRTLRRRLIAVVGQLVAPLVADPRR